MCSVMPYFLQVTGLRAFQAKTVLGIHWAYSAVLQRLFSNVCAQLWQTCYMQASPGRLCNATLARWALWSNTPPSNNPNSLQFIY